MGKQWKQWQTADGDCSQEIKRRLLLGRKAMTNLESILKSRDITLQTKVHLIKAMVFSSSHVWMWELDYKESWGPKNWCFWTVVLEKTLEGPLDCKEIQPVEPKGNQSWIFTRRTDAEAETPVLWPPDAKNWLTGKTLMLGKTEGRKRRGRQQRMRWLDGTSPNRWTWVSKLQELVMDRKPGMLQSMRSQRVGLDWATELNTTINDILKSWWNVFEVTNSVRVK